MAAKKQTAQHDSNVAVNRRARYEYDILQQWEAGIALLGSEIKSIRLGQANIAEGFGRLQDGELWLYNVHIAPYLPARVNHEPRRTRRLLLHRRQLDDLEETLREQPRTTVIPLRMYLKDGLVKVEIGVVRGRRAYDKRQVIAAREAGRTMQRALRHSVR
ncbi:MAG: SsrA-binding protein SmpB [Dehalococcoidia bacterium]